MRIMKPLAIAAAGSLLLAGLSVVAATSASAADDGPLLPGNIYLLNQKQTGPLAGPGFSLDGATAANVVTSGNNTLRPWASITVDTACPAGTAASQSNVRIPQAGVPAIDWDEVLINGQQAKFDSLGRPFNDSNSNPVISGAIAAYVTSQGGTGTLPLTVNCRTAAGEVLGHFEIPLTIVGATDAGTWSVPASPALGSSPAVSTATVLTAVAAGPNVNLTATVSPSAAGSVAFFDGSTSLGAAVPVAAGVATKTVEAPAVGPHSYKATFTPTDTTAYTSSDSAVVAVTVSPVAGSGDITLTLGVPDAPAGTLTLSVPAAATVALTGSRDAGNTRVTATAPLPAIKVVDTRRDNLLSNWQVNVQASDFVAGAGATGTVGAKYLGWKPAVPTSVKPNIGDPLVAQAGSEVASAIDTASSNGLATSQLLAKAITAGRGETTLGAALNLAIPGATAGGSYTSTITVTLVNG